VISHVRTSDPSLQNQSLVKIPLNGNSSDKLVVVVKTLSSSPISGTKSMNEVKVGSVSIPQDLFLQCGESRYRQWITLFDHIDDDEYDGDFGENDLETPRV
jgi:hypothetical protein